MNELYCFRKGLDGLTRVIDQGAWPYEDGVETSMRFRLAVYCHIMEADFPYVVFLNLCRVAEGRDPCWTFFARNRADDSIKMNEKMGTPILLDTIDKKIKHLKRYELARSTGLPEALGDLWHNDLRNAFSHSQYVLSTKGDVIYTKWFTGACAAQGTDVTTQEWRMNHESLKELSRAASAYFDAFRKGYAGAIEPYLKADRVSLSVGDVRLNQDTQEWEPLGGGNH